MKYPKTLNRNKKTAFSVLLSVVLVLLAGAAVAQPSFTGGTSQHLTVCENSVDSINSLLSISDPTSGSTETWSNTVSPLHGTIVATYTATSTGGTVTPTGLYYTPTAGYSGTDAFTIQVSNGVTTSLTAISVTVTATPAAIGGGTSVCSGATTTLTDGTSGGVWSSTATSVASISTGGIVTGISQGITVISYTKSGCAVTKTITDKNTPSAISGSSFVCNGSTTVLSDTSNYGTWSSSTTYYASINSTTGVVTGLVQGGETISYTTGCGTAATYSMTTYNTPSAITGTSTICAGATTTLGNTATNGTWSSTNPYIATNSGAVFTGVANGTVTVTYSTGCGVTASTTLTVKGVPAVISGPTTLCVGSTATFSDTTLGGTWSSSSTGRASVISTTGVATGVSAGTLNIVYTNSCGTAATYPITVIAAPAAITGTSTVCVTADVILADAAAGGIWSSSNTGIANNSGSTFTGVSAGSVTATYSTGCGSPATITLTVKSTPSSISGSSAICEGSSYTFTDSSAGGTWSSSYTPRATVVASTGVVTGVSIGAVNITYTNGCGTSVYPTTVFTTPAAITGTTTFCSGADVILADGTTGGTWSTGDITIATNSGSTITGVASGTTTVTYSTGCGTPASTTITVKAAPSSITGVPTLCIGSSSTFTDSAFGGTWSSANTGRASVIASTGVVTGVGTGTVNITYNNGCGTATYPVNILAAPAAITGTTTECPGTNVLLSDATTGGTWSTSNAAIATNSGNSVTGVSAGTVTVTYSTGCGTPATTTVTVKGIPSLITGASTVCVGSTISLSDSATGGTWSSTSTGRATVVSSTGVVTGISAGTLNIGYTTGCGTAATYPITVVTTPAAITGTTTLYIGSSSSLSDATAYGTWSSASPSVATVGTTGIVTGIGAGTSIISYNTGCGSAATNTVTVSSGPAPISGGSSVCVGSTLSLSDVTTGGTWSSSNSGIASVNTSGTVTGVAGGTVTIYYTTSGGRASAVITSVASPAAITGTTTFCSGADVILSDATAGGTWSTANAAIADNTGSTIYGVGAGTTTVTYSTGCGTPATTIVTVKGAPSSITGASTICVGSNVTFTDSAFGGTWSSSSTARASVIASTGVITGIATGTVNITYNNGCGTATAPLTIFNSPAAITGTTTECAGTDVILSDATTGGTWSTSNSAIATNSVNDITGVSAGTVTVTYSTGCGTPATTVVTVKGIPSVITGASTVCVGSTITLSDSTSGGTWSSSNTGRATVVASTGVVTGVSAGTVNINYTTGCGTTATYAITVVNTPAAITGTTNVCPGSSTVLADATAGGTWTTSDPTIATNSGSTITGIATGTVTITYNNGCSVGATTVYTVKGVPSVITGASTVCTGATITLSDSAVGGTWSSSYTTRASVVAATGVVTGVNTGAVNINYSTGCGTTATYAITVLPSPAAITGTTSECIGADVVLADATAGGTWSTSNTAIATNSGSVITGVSAGTVTVTYNNGCGTGATTTVTVKANPTAISGSTNVCTGTTSLFTDAAVGGTWSSSNTARATVISATGVVTGIAAGAVNISYSNGCGTSVGKAITIISSPAAITGTTQSCISGTSSLADATTGGTWSSSATGIATINSSGTVYGVSAGTSNITYTAAGCSTAATFTVNAAPVSIAGTTTFCTGATDTLTDASTNGTWSSSSSAIASVNSLGAVTGVSNGVATITYANGCGSAATTTVNVQGAPTVISGSNNFCVGSIATYTDSVTGGTWSTSDATVATIDPSSGIATGIGAGVVTISYSLTNACGSNTVIYTAHVATPGSWIGTSSTNWSDAGNWVCGIVPDSTTCVTINAATPYAPSVSSAAYTRCLTIASGAIVTINSGNKIYVYGSLANSGTVTGNGSISFTNSIPEALYGDGYVNNIEINSSSTVTVNAGDTTKIKGTLTLTAGTLTTNGGIELSSDSLNTGRIGTITGGTISGNVIIQQYIEGGRRAYRFWAHPFATSIPLSQLQQSIDITGTGGSTNGFTSTITNAASAYWYKSLAGNSSMGVDPGWKAFTNTDGVDSNAFNSYEGIRLFIRGAKGEGLTGASYTPSPVTVNMYGQVNTGSVTETMVKGSGAYADYNLLGNPYPSPVDIGTVLSNAQAAGQITGSSFYVWDPYFSVSGQFVVVPIGSPYYLEANASFEVRTAANGNVLNFSESNKSTSGSDILLRNADQFIKLDIYDAGYHQWDMMYLSFNDAATDADDAHYDGQKPPSPAPFNFYSLSSDNAKLSLDARPYKTGNVIPLGVQSTYAQQFIIKADNMVLPQDGTLYLVDKYLGETVQLEQGTEYKFTITTDAASQGEKRFELRMGDKNADAVANATMNMMPNPATDEVNLTYNMQSTGNVTLRLTDIAGNVVINNDLGTQQNGTTKINLQQLPAGMYIAELSCGNNKITQKLVKE